MSALSAAEDDRRRDGRRTALPTNVVIIDVIGLVLAVLGFHMAFRQSVVRQLIGRLQPSKPERVGSAQSHEDPLTYVLRISGVMIMVFGVVIAGMVTAFHFATSAPA